MLKTIAALTLVLSACTDPAPPRSTTDAFPAPSAAERTTPTDGLLAAPEQQQLKITALEQREGAVTLVDHDSDNAVELPGSPCECTTQACVDSWVEATFGCDIEVDLVCPGGERRGGLVLCSEQDPHLGL